MFFFKKIYLKGWDKEICLLAECLNDNTWAWVRRKPGTGSWTWSPIVGGSNAATWIIVPCLPGNALAASWNQKWSQCWWGMWASQEVPEHLHQTPAPISDTADSSNNFPRWIILILNCGFQKNKLEPSMVA